MIIGFTNGCFDLLHAGHLLLLREANQVCDWLYVAVNTDASVRRLKGPLRPAWSLERRMEALRASGLAHEVFPMHDDTPHRLLLELQPDVLIKGGSTGIIIGAELLASWGGRVHRTALLPGISTTLLLEAEAQP